MHLFPGISIATAGAIFYLLVTGGVQRFHSVLMLFSSMFLISAAIGSMNDYLLRRSRSGCPGRTSPSSVANPACNSAVVSGVAATAEYPVEVWSGWTTVAIALLPLASGMVYNFWAKGTIRSWVPYAISISALPVWAFVAAGKFKPLVLLTLPLGILVSLAVNLANTLPDLPNDIRHGVKGLAHRLGPRRSIVVIWCSLGMAIGLLALSPVALGNKSQFFFPGLLLGSLLLLVMIVDYSVSRSNESFKRGWYFTVILTALLGSAWVASLSSG